LLTNIEVFWNVVNTDDQVEGSACKVSARRSKNGSTVSCLVIVSTSTVNRMVVQTVSCLVIVSTSNVNRMVVQTVSCLVTVSTSNVNTKS
jgi:hypothetical protein